MVAGVMGMKIFATLVELLLPYIMEHLIDNVAPARDLPRVFLWGAAMLALAVLNRFLNVTGNRQAVKVSQEVSYEIRRDLFRRSLSLSGSQTDQFGLPSLTSRMTVDSYNVQDFVRLFQSMGVRAPMLLIGGVCVSMTMDRALSGILCVMAPIAVFVVVFVSFKGIPLYDKVQQSVDGISRVMRENITGVRVVKALSKQERETARFAAVNEEMSRRERRAGVTMSLPGPIMTLTLNVGLTLVVLVGGWRVNAGQAQPGVILAFLTYFNMILMGVMGLNRIFLTMSKANASANRIAAVLATGEALPQLPPEQAARTDSDAFILFDDVSFRYGQEGGDGAARMSLEHISFSVKKGGTLGILGPTGCGKTTIVNLLMRFYDPTCGHVFLDGRDVRTYDRDALRRRFGVVFQNDAIFADTLAENISFGRDLDPEQLRAAARDACAAEFVEGYQEQYQHRVSTHGADLSGGQRQRVLIARALAGEPEVLILDDASSALDYKTDAALRQAIRERHRDATAIIVAQRVSSILSLDQILVLDEGRIIGQGTHRELLESCPAYREIYRIQMGEEG
jgi:ATP-binding cassette subfamily B protein